MSNSVLQGKRVLLTGGSRGIGRAIATLFAAQGARIFFTYHKNEAAAKSTYQELSGSGHAYAQLDQGDPMAIPPLVEQAVQKLGGLDILINNAGIYLEHDPLTSSYSDWVISFQTTLQADLSGPAHLCHQAIAHFQKQGSGRIINIGSRGAYRGEPGHPGYAAAKAGLHALTQSLAKAVGGKGIYCFALAPGFVATDMASGILEGPEGEAIRGQSPLERVARPAEIAEAALYFASGKGDFSTGCILDINGASYLR